MKPLYGTSSLPLRPGFRQAPPARGVLFKAGAWFGIFAFCFAAAAQTFTVSVTPSADAFMRSTAPTTNYGAAGAISVSGLAAVNGSGVQNGAFDTLLRF